MEEKLDVTPASVVGWEGRDEDDVSVAKGPAEVVADVALEVAADANVPAEVVADVAAEVSVVTVLLVAAIGFVVSVIATLGDDCSTLLVALGSAVDV